MNHLSRKKRLHGAGSKKPEVKPAVLNPPKIGDFQFGASFSFLETLDLISDGPIEGLVDNKGNLLPDNYTSRGIYLDDTPVSIALDSEVDIDYDQSIEELQNISLTIDSFSNLNDEGASVSTFREGSNQFFRGKLNFLSLVDGISPFLSPDAFTKRRFRTVSKGFNYNFTTSEWDRFHAVFPNESSLSASDFVVLFEKDTKIRRKGNIDLWKAIEQKNGTFAHASKYFFKQKTGSEFEVLKKIREAWNLYGPDPETKVIQNKHMHDLILRKMNSALGPDWERKTDKELHEKLFDKRGYCLIYYPDRDLLSGQTSIQFTEPKLINFDFIKVVNGNEVKVNFSQGVEIANLLMPIFDVNGNLQINSPLLGGIFIFVDQAESANFFEGVDENGANYTTKDYEINEIIKELKTITKLSLSQSNKPEKSKYNYNNVLIETRLGKEIQQPFSFFNKVHIDKKIDRNIYGPFRSLGQVQRLARNTLQDKEYFKMNDSYYDGPWPSNNEPDDADRLISLDSRGLPTNEGSNDTVRVGSSTRDKDFSSWNSQNRHFQNEENDAPITHIIQNPNVSDVFITLKINSLFDTVEKQYGSEPEDFKLGDKLPAILNVEVEVGKVLGDGSLRPSDTRVYRIAALIESPTLLDIGNPDALARPKQYKHVRDLNNGGAIADVSQSFSLPSVYSVSNSNVNSSVEKRYIKVSKLSTETFSVLISKDVSLYKVTEIIPVNLTYPFSAIIGTKIDSKSFSSVPQRTFDSRLKLIKIPNNYYPTQNTGSRKDKRYFNTVAEFTSSEEENKKIYKGDWNGGFKIGWTDNPAWILYDLLTNPRYGLGQYIEPQDINKWELYKIGRFCDAVDSNGVFEGVPDGRGGLEPRYSCNIIFQSDEKVFDSIQLISKLFRGHTFFRSSEVSFSDERIKSAIATFNNNNVKDGVFSYSTLRRDQQFNTVEVSYLDRFENFSPKVETVEDEEDIRSRGVFKKRIDGLGVTSRAMARRMAQHLIYRTIKENQRVVFTSGLEALLCQPGDLIIVDDDLKNEKSNFGKILEVDVDTEFIRLSGPYSSSSMQGTLTVYNPTGEDSISDLNDKSVLKRFRAESFSVTQSFETDFDIYTGLYEFSGYTEGFDTTEDTNLYEQYALYTGTGDNILYFNNDYTGWIFATGLNESDDHYIAQDTGIENLTELNTGKLVNYDTSAANKRDTTEFNISGYISGDLNPLNSRGILESEIALNSEPHIVTLTASVVNSTGDGSYVSGVDAAQYLPFIKLGSPYRFDLKNADNILYKIESIKENSPNEYLVAASKFETGKFSLIENDISLEREENTFDYNVATQIGDTTYITLSSPENLTISTGQGTEADTIYISGDWDNVTNNYGYETILRFPNKSSQTSGVNEDVTSVVFDNLSAVGNYSLSVKALGDTSTVNKYLDSDFSTVRSFILYDKVDDFDKSFTKIITFR
jgi:hypothetical protein